MRTRITSALSAGALGLGLLCCGFGVAQAEEGLPYSKPVTASGLPAGEELTVNAPKCDGLQSSIVFSLSKPADTDAQDVQLVDDQGTPGSAIAQWYSTTEGSADITLAPGASYKFHLVFTIRSLLNGGVVTETYEQTPTISVASCDPGATPLPSQTQTVTPSPSQTPTTPTSESPSSAPVSVTPGAALPSPSSSSGVSSPLAEMTSAPAVQTNGALSQTGLALSPWLVIGAGVAVLAGTALLIWRGIVTRRTEGMHQGDGG